MHVISTFLRSLVLGLASVVSAIHKHHHHGQKDNATGTVETEYVPGPTVIAYQLDGERVEQAEVCEGFRQGRLTWADNKNTPPPCPPDDGTIPQHAQAASVTGTITDASPVTAIAPLSSAISEQASSFPPNVADPSQDSQSTPPTPTTSSSQPMPSTAVSSDIPDSQGLENEFPSGSLSCSTFPSEYGPIPIDWQRMDGWSGIQYPIIENGVVTHIDTAIAGQKCGPGAYCSYACPQGSQKSQWPKAQGATGQTIGGLKCNEAGMLELTNPEISKSLCMPGAGILIVENRTSKNNSICRTDYPGTEDETIPVTTQPGESGNLTIPDAKNCFKHEGNPTSAQYYVNNPGMPVSSACTWNTDGSHAGNWAPTFCGLGKDVNGRTWLQLATTAQNNPSDYEPLDMTMEVEGETSGKCRLKDGMYCSGENYENCNPTSCLVELTGPTKLILTN